MGPVRRVLFIILLILAIAAAFGFIWTLMPAPRQVHTITFPDDLSSLYGKKSITLEFPSSLRLGETGRRSCSSGLLEVNLPPWTARRKNLFIFNPGSICLAFMHCRWIFNPQNSIPQTGAEFPWRLLPVSGGDFEGTLKVYASRGDPLPPGEEGELIFAIPIKIRVTSLLGLPLDLERFFSLFVLVLAGVGGVILLTSRRRQNGLH